MPSVSTLKPQVAKKLQDLP